ncbi:ATP-binding protein [Streptomyces sp. SBST2-5]|uniref:ATP-binding protein n=1 Tax=Streptomyces composti TaxID=2720025 RepID=A0ABX1A144_9ACTN|nr:ATP-binding protein [Streptomyces composti]NJP50105.1 ATP-binding protein [Streptomyces composti]
MADNPFSGITADQVLAMVQEAHTQAATALSQEEAARTAVMSLLAQVGGTTVGEKDLIFEGSKFVLPEQYEGKIGEAIDFLDRYRKQQGKTHEYSKIFRYRPYDVAHALTLALQEVFGSTGMGESWTDMFGQEHPPQFIEVPTGVNTSVQVPWDLVAMPILGPEATIEVGYTRDRDLGMLGKLSIRAPRGVKAQVEGLFKVIEKHLSVSSLYKGKALIGGDALVPAFLDVRKVNPAHVIYSDDVLQQLNTNIWALIEHTDLMRELGEVLKRAVLLEGPYGTGKSLAAFLTAQKCVEHGWTFLFVKPGDDLDAAMRTAQLYAPAVVFFEDIDVIGEAGDPARVSKLLDSFDGIGAKGAEVVAILTTNRKDKIHKGMLRPGRLDAVISINYLDQAGVEKLIKAHVPADMLRVMDYGKVFEAFADFTPAFAKEAISRAKRYAIAREGGKPRFLTTSDFIGAANSLKPQLDLMHAAEEEKATPTVDKAFREVVADVIDAMRPVDSDGGAAQIYGAEEDVAGFEVDREELPA